MRASLAALRGNRCRFSATFAGRSKAGHSKAYWSEATEKKCSYCDEIKPIAEFIFYKSGKNAGYPRAWCRSCSTKTNQEWIHQTGRKRRMTEATDCTLYLGVHIAERALSTYFIEITRMPFGNPGYDFVCGKGFKIDVKSSCRRQPQRKKDSDRWSFHTEKNVIADFFLCLAFDSRESLNPEHIWLVPSKVCQSKNIISMSNSPVSLKKWEPYERPLGEVVARCTSMRAKEVLA